MSEHIEPRKPEVPASTLTPEMQATINASISQAVAEVFKNMGPMLERISLTPEKLAEAEKLRRAPDPALVAREARERALMREDLEKARRDTEIMQKNCTHKDNNMRWSISLVHNYPDRQSRGICTHCFKYFQPTHWEIGPPDVENPRGKAFLVKEDPMYHIIREIESTPN